jgi:hypothetical protein
MAGISISGSEARRYANYARMGGIVLLVAAGGLWALQAPGMNDLPAKPVLEAAKPDPNKTTQVAAPKVDQETIVGSAERLDMAVVKAPKEDPKPVAAAKPEVPEAPGGAPEWTFLGPIKEANRTLAIVSIDGTQRVISEGRVVGDTKLVSISDDRITVQNGSVKREIRKSNGDGPRVAWIRNMPTNAPPTGAGSVAVAGAPGGGAGQLSPEVRARLAERGINPEQMERFRQAQQQQRRGGQGNGNGNGGGRGPGGGVGDALQLRGDVQGGRQRPASDVVRRMDAETAN